MGPILAIDAARKFGFAEGIPGSKPVSGTGEFAPVGSSHGAVFAGAFRWINDRLKLTSYDMIVIEAPLPVTFAGGATNINTTKVLFGLPAVIETVAFLRGVYRVRTAKVSDVRRHFIGSNPRGAIGKTAVQRRCVELGWIEGRADPDRCDALALWSFACSIRAPDSGASSTPLFKS